jgi:hypothetical protein
MFVKFNICARDITCNFTNKGIDGVHVKYCAEVDSFVLDPTLKLPPSTTQLVLQVCFSFLFLSLFFWV